jgi:putative transposase
VVCDRRQVLSVYSSSSPQSLCASDTWAMAFVSERLFDGRLFRILMIVDCQPREALATGARTKFRAYQVIDELD